MTNFIETQREAVMQEIRNINAQFKYTREAEEAAEAAGDEQASTFWHKRCLELCDEADKVWGLLETIDKYIETLEEEI